MSKNKGGKVEIATTRFNSQTFHENINYRLKHNIPAIYSTPHEIAKKHKDTLFIVIEMNNDTNSIEGVSLLKTTKELYVNHKIYSNSRYNFNVYKAFFYISRQQLIDNGFEILVTMFDLILFKRRSHVKRLTGITAIKEKLLKNWTDKYNCTLAELKLILTQIFSVIYEGADNINLSDKLKNIVVIPNSKT